MATIGLYDADLHNMKFCAPNLGLMKIAAFEKSKRNFVSITDKIDPTFYTRFYYAQEYPGESNNIILSNPRIQAFGKEILGVDKIWTPEIELMHPDTSIYASAFLKHDAEYDNHIGARMLNGNHCRLSLDGKTIWPDYKKQLSVFEPRGLVMFHDYDISSIQGSFEEINKLTANNNLVFSCKYPLHIHSMDELEKWITLPMSTHLALFQIDYLLHRYDYTLLSRKPQPVYFNLSAVATDQTELLKEVLPRVMSMVNYFHTKYNDFLLIYDEDFLTSQRMVDFIDLINDYLSIGRQATDFDTFLRGRSKSADVSKYYEGLRYVQITSPQSYQILVEGKI